MKNKSIKELREICQPAFKQVKENPYFRIHRRFFRIFSIYITRFLIKIKFSANLASYLGLIFGVIASLSFYYGKFLLGALILQLWFLMDTLDGELARYYFSKNKKENYLIKGEYLDINSHHLVHSLIFISLGLSLFNLTKNLNFIYLGLTSVYSFLLNELIDLNKIKVLFYTNSKIKKIELRKKKSLIKRFMIIYTFPATANLILIFSIFDKINILTYFYGITFPIIVFIKLIVNLARKW